MKTESTYLKEALKITNKMGVTLEILGMEHKKHFSYDKEKRYVFKCCLKRNDKQYTFDFGQSIAKGMEKPNMYDIMTCLTKNDPESFEDFCDNFGYDTDSRKSEKIYHAVVREYKGMCRLFTEEELEQLQEIF
jgi:hypothetical protein